MSEGGPAGSIVAIHQPNFFPWLGYFDKIGRSSTFIILDTVQQQKKSGTWSNRVKLLVSGEARWITAPIDRTFHGVKPISDIRFDRRVPWRAKMVRTLAANYSRAPFYEQAMELILPLILDPDEGMASYNRTAIEAIAHALGLVTGKIVAASDLRADGFANDLLISLTRQVRGGSYMCGGGAGGYQDGQLFADAELKLLYQDFRHPIYPQHNNPGEFIAGLSVIDALMNVGLSGTRALLAQSGQVGAEALGQPHVAS